MEPNNLSRVISYLLTRTPVKFVISGGTAAAINFGTFLIFLNIFGLHYLVSSALAFCLSAISSFCLQKFWTFENLSLEEMHLQVFLFVVVALMNLALNTLLVYAFVSVVGFGYFVSQVIAGLLIAIGTFFIYRYIIFVRRISP